VFAGVGADLTVLLRRHGARDEATGTERFLSACLPADRAAAPAGR
jgi:hypothetical protein